MPIKVNSRCLFRRTSWQIRACVKPKNIGTSRAFLSLRHKKTTQVAPCCSINHWKPPIIQENIIQKTHLWWHNVFWLLPPCSVEGMRWLHCCSKQMIQMIEASWPHGPGSGGNNLTSRQILTHRYGVIQTNDALKRFGIGRMRSHPTFTLERGW